MLNFAYGHDMMNLKNIQIRLKIAYSILDLFYKKAIQPIKIF